MRKPELQVIIQAIVARLNELNDGSYCITECGYEK